MRRHLQQRGDDAWRLQASRWAAQVFIGGERTRVAIDTDGLIKVKRIDISRPSVTECRARTAGPPGVLPAGNRRVQFGRFADWEARPVTERSLDAARAPTEERTNPMAKIRPTRVSRAELEAEGALALPAKEVISLLNLNVDLDLALDLAAPIDLAVAANANVAAPIDAAVSANVLSLDSVAAASSTQQVLIDQYISGEAVATANQDAIVDQSDDTVDDGTTDGTTDDTTMLASTDGTLDATVDDTTGTVDDTVDTVDDTTGTIDDTVDDTTGTVGDTLDGTINDAVDGAGSLVDSAGALLDDGLLNVDVNAAIDADIAAPIAGAVAANANVAAPIDASVAANIASIGSQAVAVADQTAIITQSLDGVTASATADQTAEVIQ